MVFVLAGVAEDAGLSVGDAGFAGGYAPGAVGVGVDLFAGGVVYGTDGVLAVVQQVEGSVGAVQGLGDSRDVVVVVGDKGAGAVGVGGYLREGVVDVPPRGADEGAVLVGEGPVAVGVVDEGEGVGADGRGLGTACCVVGVGSVFVLGEVAVQVVGEVRGRGAFDALGQLVCGVIGVGPGRGAGEGLGEVADLVVLVPWWAGRRGGRGQ